MDKRKVLGRKCRSNNSRNKGWTSYVFKVGFNLRSGFVGFGSDKLLEGVDQEYSEFLGGLFGSRKIKKNLPKIRKNWWKNSKTRRRTGVPQKIPGDGKEYFYLRSLKSYMIFLLLGCEMLWIIQTDVEAFLFRLSMSAINEGVL